MQNKHRRNRILLVAIVIILMAVFIVIYVGFIRTDSNDINLPDSNSPVLGDTQSPDSVFVGINRTNVQQVVESMYRNDSYQRSISVVHGWSGGSSGEKVEITVSGELAHIATTRADEIRHVILTEDSCYIWYAGDTRYITCSRGDFSEMEEASIPDYTDIAELSPISISNACLETYNDIMCIRVDFSRDERLCTYWLELDSGLLYAAKEFENDSLVYSMICDSLISPLASQETLVAAFTLPDGQQLYK